MITIAGGELLVVPITDTVPSLWFTTYGRDRAARVDPCGYYKRLVSSQVVSALSGDFSDGYPRLAEVGLIGALP